MRPSLLALPLLLATFLAIGNADSSTAAAPAPSLTAASPPSSPPPPPTSPPPPPAWTPVTNVNDKTIQQVGQFAVRIYALSTGKLQLVFVNVASGQSQPYNGGYNYQLVITVAAPGVKTAQYEAFVWGILGTTTWKLWSFTPK